MSVNLDKASSEDKNVQTSQKAVQQSEPTKNRSILRGLLKPSESMADIWERSIRMIKGTKVIVEQAQNLKRILGTSKGRDKICSLIQYTAKFIFTCNVHSNIEQIQEQIRLFGKTREDKLMSGRVYNSMSKNRKIFNLFKFIDEIYNILRMNNNEKMDVSCKFFGIMTHVGALFNFLLDNLLFLLNARIVSNEYLRSHTSNLKYYRYSCCMWRVVFNFVFSILELRSYKK